MTKDISVVAGYQKNQGKVTMMFLSTPLFLSLLLLCPEISIAFRLDAFHPKSFPRPFNCITGHRRNVGVRLYSSVDDAQYAEFQLTPKQMDQLRKEASKRKTKKRLPMHFLPPDENKGDFSDETLSVISQLLEKHELVEVRAISKEQIKGVREVADYLAYELDKIIGTPVSVVSVKGFAATLFCPMRGDGPEKIKLWTSFQKNRWQRKPKALRDNRGQIVTDGDGNIVRE